MTNNIGVFMPVKKIVKKAAKKSKRTFVRIVWAEGLDKKDLKILREQVELALSNSNYAIITNYQINWEEIEVYPNPRARIVTAEDITGEEVEELRKQVDRALMDPNYTIIANYSVTWQEIPRNN